VLLPLITMESLGHTAGVRAGIPGLYRRVLLAHFDARRIQRCPFANLPDRGDGCWGEGLTAAIMAWCRWLNPFIVARIEFLEWTPTIDCGIHGSPAFGAIKMRVL